MEEELHYATVVFSNGRDSSKEKNEDSTIYTIVKPKGPSTTITHGEAAAHSQHLRPLVFCLGILCVALVAGIIYVTMEMNGRRAEFTANLNNLTIENQRLITDKSVLEIKTEELSRDRDDLNWTLAVILQFKTFPVNEYCPKKVCRPCLSGWIQFQGKCYLFYMKNYDWKTWGESRTYCRSTTADLVVIDSLQEQEFISNHTKYYYDKYHGYWFGLHRSADKNWLWVDGRNDSLGYWMTPQLGDPGLCALMIPGRNATASWDTANCFMLNRFICERDVLMRSD